MGRQVLIDGDRVRTGVRGVGEYLDHLTGGLAGRRRNLAAPRLESLAELPAAPGL